METFLYTKAILFSIVVTMTPGVDTALVLKSATSESITNGFKVVLGISLGLIFHAILCSTGLSQIVSNSKSFLNSIQFLGAGYLIFLGISNIFVKRECNINYNSNKSSPIKVGLITNILNPKITLFYLSSIPQFTGKEGSLLFGGILFSSIHILTGVIWFGFLIIMTQMIKNKFDIIDKSLTLTKVFGIMLTIIGISFILNIYR